MKQNKKIAFTLAEGATHVTTCGNNKRFAFTLAEVLITLGIIGVVVAMTLPTLIQNYRKQQTVTQLKSTYSILSQAFEHAQAEYGDVSTWGLNEMYGSKAKPHEAYEMISKFIETYFVPYVKPIENYGITSFKELKYNGIYYLNGQIDGNTYGAPRYIITLSNGAITTFSLDGHCYAGYTEEGTWHCSDYRHTDVYIVADINGKKLPNTIGKDIFVMSLNSKTNKFEFYNYPSYANNRNWLLRACSNLSKENHHCGRLIQLDGWKINYDW